VSDDDECIHLNDPALCTICNGKDSAGKRTVRSSPKAPVAKRAPSVKAPRPVTTSRRLTTSVVSRDTPESVEDQRSKFPEDRQETFDAYVLVFFNTDARDFPGGFANFTRCASAEPERKATSPALVARAERYMRDAGYEADDSGRPQKIRRWFMD
jgi:hypothetical protein